MFYACSERIARVSLCIEPCFTLQIDAKPKFAHRLQTLKMRRNSTSLNTCQHDVDIVTICTVEATKTVGKAFYALVKHFAH